MNEVRRNNAVFKEFNLYPQIFIKAMGFNELTLENKLFLTFPHYFPNIVYLITYLPTIKQAANK